MKAYQQARLARDNRYDGKFFVAVKTTRIYCRPICPAPVPKEVNVEYFESAIAAHEAGFRPCRRCRPESAPQSAAWKGTQSVLQKAIKKIQAGALNNTNFSQFSESLGISERYLRKLFQQHLGTSPQRYHNHVRLMFAKQLLHQTQLSITQIAYSAGFNSIRRFNDAFKSSMQLTPTEVRKSNKQSNSSITIQLGYYGDYNWTTMRDFLLLRKLPIEMIGDDYYQRSFTLKTTDLAANVEEVVNGKFKAIHCSDNNCFNVTIEISNIAYLMAAVARIRKVLDIDSNVELIESHLKQDVSFAPLIKSGLRLPACWNSFEAGVKAILGQQVSVKAAYGHSKHLIEQINSQYDKQLMMFPTPQEVVNTDLSFLRMPNARKETLKLFALWCCDNNDHGLESILNIKGIGPWTYEYVKLRSGNDADAFPSKDLGVIKAIEKYQLSNPEQWQPWRSYATLHLWNSL